MDSCPEKKASYLWQRGKRRGAKCVCSKIVKRPNPCFLRKFLGCKAPINVHTMWNMNRPGLWLIPQCKPSEELESATQAAISRGKREAFHLNWMCLQPAEGQRKQYKLGSAKKWRCKKRVPGVCPGHMPDDSPASLQLFPSWIQQPCRSAHISKDLRFQRNNTHFSSGSPSTGSGWSTNPLSASGSRVFLQYFRRPGQGWNCWESHQN